MLKGEYDKLRREYTVQARRLSSEIAQRVEAERQLAELAAEVMHDDKRNN